MPLDRTRFGELLRSQREIYKEMDDWRPVYASQNNRAVRIAKTLWGDNPPWVQDKAQVINGLIGANDYKEYLEIGGQPWSERSTFAKIVCERKDSVNPGHEDGRDEKHKGQFEDKMSPGNNHYHLYSDEFFKEACDKKYDIVFIDGFHEHSQVYRDIENSLNNLTDNGIIVLHDMIPLTRDLETSPFRTGDCWRGFADFRKREDLQMHVLVPPWGSEDSLGFIKKGSQVPFEKEIEYNYDFLLDNIEDLMSLIDLKSFIEIYLPQVNKQL
mgnify:CR=1 FL=1|tara:strand:- start:468 stop:1277 length:810 start_codon:yes stop_codon:yes gene_type:complete